MAGLALQMRGLSKQYMIGRRAAYAHLTETMSDALARPFRRKRPPAQSTDERILWALKGVSLDVDQGEVFGVIGKNGAGKTTLLKILSRITEPTEGYADVRGRVGSLLEVGTGFHPELTGRENVYLNGAILGMRKHEIDKRFDEIVDFAEIDRFLDTPVKFYSSGMYVRLGFAVAAHFDPEILLLDEVLAVGDFAFQQKCLQKMRRVGETGSTVVFISHNLAAVRSFCTSCAWIDDGRVASVGDTERCVSDYLAAVSPVSSELDVLVADAERPAGMSDVLRFTRVQLHSEHEDKKLRRGDPVKVDLQFTVTRSIEDVALGFSILSTAGTTVLQCLNTHSERSYALNPGTYSVEVVVAENILVDGRYVLGVLATTASESLDWLRDVIEFEVAESTQTPGWMDAGHAGVVRLPSRFGHLQMIDGRFP